MRLLLLIAGMLKHDGHSRPYKAQPHLSFTIPIQCLQALNNLERKQPHLSLLPQFAQFTCFDPSILLEVSSHTVRKDRLFSISSRTNT